MNLTTLEYENRSSEVAGEGPLYVRICIVFLALCRAIGPALILYITINSYVCIHVMFSCFISPGNDVPISSSSLSSSSSAPTQTPPLSPNINVLASKFKSPQSFLAALQKTGNFPQNIKSLAAYVLASPLLKGAATQGQTKVTQGMCVVEILALLS